MQFLFVLRTKKKTRVIGSGEKDKIKFSTMLIGLFIELLKITTKENIIECIELAEKLKDKEEYNG